MRGRAVWRMRHDEPRSWLGWVVQDRRHWGIVVLKKAVLAVLATALYAIFVGQTVAGIFLFGALVLLVKAMPPRQQGPTPADPPPGVAFSGTVEVWRDRALLGEDRVVATFVDGWLVVEGLRTSFSLANDDAIRPKVRAVPIPILTLTDGTELRFSLGRTIHGESMAALARGMEEGVATFSEERRIARGAAFEDELARWRDGALPMGESVLPPARPHPAALARAAVEVGVSLVGFFATVAVCAEFGLGWGMLAVLLVPGPPPGSAIHTLLRLRRLAREA